MKKRQLSDIEGMQIRRQLFIVPIGYALLVFMICLEVFTIMPLVEGTFDINKWLADVREGVTVMVLFVIPCVILSVLNRRYFGRIVCVLNDGGLHHEYGTIQWGSIRSMRFHPTQIGRRRFTPAYMEVVCENTTVRLESVPLYVCAKAKQFNADIKTGVNKNLFYIWLAVSIVAAVVNCVV